MTIAELNRKITFNQYGFSQNEYGDNVKALVNTFAIWAKVEPISNSRTLEQLQVTYGEAYKVTTRYEVSRPISSNNEIIYESKVLSIAGIREDTEGSKKYNVITAYSTGKSLVAEDTGTLAIWQVIEW